MRRPSWRRPRAGRTSSHRQCRTPTCTSTCLVLSRREASRPTTRHSPHDAVPQTAASRRRLGDGSGRCRARTTSTHLKGNSTISVDRVLRSPRECAVVNGGTGDVRVSGHEPDCDVSHYTMLPRRNPATHRTYTRLIRSLHVSPRHAAVLCGFFRLWFGKRRPFPPSPLCVC